ncbi:cache domain-containing protein [Methanosphaerula palustris]|uniref:Putative cache sensor protein n=1 Tax=Methanosphaerula palustris (strain ATCC BAA-1556 / DSM 19958 / E1-9c) TaxID=521011 RepID=B8GF27_METPE|nr:cache domain-containing protein [Methanosphaerula palustris]ACL17833.1 putative cache sensor protein [Methanosphaerula palustris E1-9c]
MKKQSLSFLILLVIGASLLVAGCVQNQPVVNTTTPAPTSTLLQQANATSNTSLVSFVDSAVAYAKTNGKERALAEFNNPNGSFVKGELYIYAYDFNGTTIAHPFNPEKIGINRMNETDAQGGLFIKNLTDMALNGTGFVQFAYINPAHNNSVESKLGYVEKVDDTWYLGSGIYNGPVNTIAKKTMKQQQ